MLRFQKESSAVGRARESVLFGYLFDHSHVTCYGGRANCREVCTTLVNFNSILPYRERIMSYFVARTFLAINGRFKTKIKVSVD